MPSKDTLTLVSFRRTTASYRCSRHVIDRTGSSDPAERSTDAKSANAASRLRRSRESRAGRESMISSARIEPATMRRARSKRVLRSGAGGQRPRDPRELVVDWLDGKGLLTRHLKRAVDRSEY